jgi:transcription elongation factor Elf1
MIKAKVSSIGLDSIAQTTKATSYTKKRYERNEVQMSELLEKDISCPYCGESIDVVIEILEENQEYIEDCQVCCRPIVFNIAVAFDGSPSISVHSEDETY